MKKLLIILSLLTIFLANAFSSEPVRITAKADNRFLKNESYISIGSVSCVGLIGGVSTSIADSIAEANKQLQDKEKEPFEAFSLGLGYNLFLVDFIGLGGFLNFERFGQLYLMSAQAKITAQYGFTHFKFYHSVSGGVLYISEAIFTPIFDVTVLGLKLDFDDFNVFLEASFPSTAFLKLGYAYYF